MNETICSIEGCEKKATSRGWCTTHWSRWNRHGDPLAGGDVRIVGRTQCSIEGCTNEHYGHGWCRLHWNRWKRTGDPLTESYATDGEPAAFLDAKLAEETDECIIWPFSKTDYGHGQISINRRPVRVHIIACEYAHGPRPLGMYATHGPCHNPACFNPRHLSWETPAKNMADKLRDGTHMEGEQVPTARLTRDQVDEIRRRWPTCGMTQKSLGREYGISGAQVSRIINRQSWAWA